MNMLDELSGSIVKPGNYCSLICSFVSSVCVYRLHGITINTLSGLSSFIFGYASISLGWQGPKATHTLTH